MPRKIAFALLMCAVAAAGISAAPAAEAALGSESRPIVWAFVPSGETQRVAAGAESMAKLLHDKTGLYIKTLVATDYPGVIEAMRSKPPTAQMASLATFAYVTAADLGVAQADLVALRNNSTTYLGEIITQANSGIKKLADLKGKTFARPDPLSTSGWIVPTIMLRGAGVDPTKDLKIVDAGSHDAVVAAVYNGDVNAGACYVDARTRLQSTKADVMEKVAVIGQSIPIPNDGVQFSPSVPQELRDKIVSAMLEIAQTDAGKKAINEAYQWTGLERCTDAFYDPFRQFLQAAGIKAAELIK